MSADPLTPPPPEPEEGIGDIRLSPEVVSTPSGRSSTRQVEWTIDDGSTPPRWTGSAPGTGRPDEAQVVGAVRVTATAPGWKHVTAVPVTTLEDVTAIYAKVLHARRHARQRTRRR